MSMPSCRRFPLRGAPRYPPVPLNYYRGGDAMTSCIGEQRKRVPTLTIKPVGSKLRLEACNSSVAVAITRTLRGRITLKVHLPV